MRKAPKRLSQRDKQYHVYALVDPRDNSTRYVGTSDDIEYRFYQHLLRIGVGKQEECWIKELQQLGLTPVLQILEAIQATSNQRALAYERERYWIQEMLREGYSLLNVLGVSQAYPHYDFTIQRSKVRELRIKAALNVSRLSQLSGVSRPSIEKMEKGEAVRADLASAVCRVLSERLGYEVSIEDAEIRIL